MLSQTYRNLELFVVDDASTDHTKAVVESFDDRRLRYIRLDTNSRAAAARNVGIRASSGQFLAFQDDDDEWLSHKLERQVASLMRAPGEVGLNMCSFRRVDEAGESYVGGERYLHYLDFDDYFVANDFSLISTPNLLLRRNVIDKVGLFDERFQSLDDWEFALRIFDAFRYEHLDEALRHRFEDRERLDLRATA